MSTRDDLTYSEAIEQVMLANGNFAPLKLLYAEVWKYKDRSKITGKTPDNTIQERVQRDPRFTRIAKGVYALTKFLNEVEDVDLGYFTVKDDTVTFTETKRIRETERIARQKVRIGQLNFRNSLLSEMAACPVTGIDDKRILIASHIKPWVHSNNEERLNSKNGLTLSPLFDRLFDMNVGLITFTPEKRILISSKLSGENVHRLQVKHEQIIERLDVNGREEFLDYHRRFIFQG